ncbi:MAG: hypothetical protein E6Q88_14975 [Lysobacteraceae bacterium]|nr:MAG: hypothetical protein E6Q88_14975 [Xanthomonadaceae bacterium]
MSATLIAVIFALALGHLAPALAVAVRRYDWYGVWLRWLSNRMPSNPVVSAESLWRMRSRILVALAPPLLLVGLFQFALRTPLAGVVGLLFAVVVLFYVWGPRDLDADVDAVIDAEDPDGRREAARRLDARMQTHPGDGGLMVEAVFANALRRWFGVLFWFLLLGPVGALLYRLTTLAAEGEFAQSPNDDASEGARYLLSWLDWPVAQAMALSLALVGNFDTVIGAWRDGDGASFRLGNGFLGAAARASVRSEIAEEAQELIEEGASPGNAWAQLGALPELRDAMSLVWRILLLWMVILALFVVAGWVS